MIRFDSYNEPKKYWRTKWAPPYPFETWTAIAWHKKNTAVSKHVGLAPNNLKYQCALTYTCQIFSQWPSNWPSSFFTGPLSRRTRSPSATSRAAWPSCTPWRPCTGPPSRLSRPEFWRVKTLVDIHWSHTWGRSLSTSAKLRVFGVPLTTTWLLQYQIHATFLTLPDFEHTPSPLCVRT